MPVFSGQIVQKIHNQTAFGELYEFNIIPPTDETFDLQAVIPAFVTPEVTETHIAEELARKFGCVQSGDAIEVMLHETQIDGSTCSFLLPVVVNFASPNRGSHYVQLGLDDLQEHFELNIHQNKTIRTDRFLQMKRKANSDRECVDSQLDVLAAV